MAHKKETGYRINLLDLYQGALYNQVVKCFQTACNNAEARTLKKIQGEKFRCKNEILATLNFQKAGVYYH